jgi:hypothetical protein
MRMCVCVCVCEITSTMCALAELISVSLSFIIDSQPSSCMDTFKVALVGSPEVGKTAIAHQVCPLVPALSFLGHAEEAEPYPAVYHEIVPWYVSILQILL